MNKIKSFTILESVTTLAIMGIIIGFVYFIYISFSEQLFLFSNSKVTYFEYRQLNFFIRSDFFDSKKIQKINDSTFILTKIDNTEIEYIITNSKIERNTFDSKMDFDVEISAFNLNGISNSIPLVIIEYNLFNEKVNNYFYKDFGNSNSINQTDFYED